MVRKLIEVPKPVRRLTEGLSVTISGVSPTHIVCPIDGTILTIPVMTNPFKNNQTVCSSCHRTIFINSR
jgi:hypothetical protein